MIQAAQEGSGGGAITAGGLYTAPSNAGTYQVAVTSAADASQSATATVSVNAPAPVVCNPPCLSGETCSKLSNLSDPSCNGDQCQDVKCPGGVSCTGSLGSYTVDPGCTAFDPGRAVGYGADCANSITGHHPSQETCKVGGANTMHCDFPEGSIDCPAVWIHLGSPDSSYFAGCCSAEPNSPPVALPYCGIPGLLGGSQRVCVPQSAGNGWSPAPWRCEPRLCSSHRLVRVLPCASRTTHAGHQVFPADSAGCGEGLLALAHSWALARGSPAPQSVWSTQGCDG